MPQTSVYTTTNTVTGINIFLNISNCFREIFTPVNCYRIVFFVRDSLYQTSPIYRCISYKYIKSQIIFLYDPSGQHANRPPF